MLKNKFSLVMTIFYPLIKGYSLYHFHFTNTVEDHSSSILLTPSLTPIINLQNVEKIYKGPFWGIWKPPYESKYFLTRVNGFQDYLIRNVSQLLTLTIILTWMCLIENTFIQVRQESLHIFSNVSFKVNFCSLFNLKNRFAFWMNLCRRFADYVAATLTTLIILVKYNR